MRDWSTFSQPALPQLLRIGALALALTAFCLDPAATDEPFPDVRVMYAVDREYLEAEVTFPAGQLDFVTGLQSAKIESRTHEGVENRFPGAFFTYRYEEPLPRSLPEEGETFQARPVQMDEAQQWVNSVR